MGRIHTASACVGKSNPHWVPARIVAALAGAVEAVDIPVWLDVRRGSKARPHDRIAEKKEQIKLKSPQLRGLPESLAERNRCFRSLAIFRCKTG